MSREMWSQERVADGIGLRNDILKDEMKHLLCNECDPDNHMATMYIDCLIYLVGKERTIEMVEDICGRWQWGEEVMEKYFDWWFC